MSRKVKVLRSGDCRVTLQLEAAPFCRKIDRRLLATDVDAEVGLITYVWSRIGQMVHTKAESRTGSVSGVGVVADEVKTRGNGISGTFKRDMTKDEMAFRHSESSGP